MNKSILVIDTPKDCTNCPCHHRDNAMVRNKEWCYAGMRALGESEIKNSKPEWCPLKKVPRKRPLIGIDGVNSTTEIRERSRQEGFNSCIDEILKESER